MWEMVSESSQEMGRNCRSENIRDGRFACICGGDDGHLCILRARKVGQRVRQFKEKVFRGRCVEKAETGSTDLRWHDMICVSRCNGRKGW